MSRAIKAVRRGPGSQNLHALRCRWSEGARCGGRVMAGCQWASGQASQVAAEPAHCRFSASIQFARCRAAHHQLYSGSKQFAPKYMTTHHQLYSGSMQFALTPTPQLYSGSMPQKRCGPQERWRPQTRALCIWGAANASGGESWRCAALHLCASNPQIASYEEYSTREVRCGRQMRWSSN